jgi:two-component system sensor kinase FixL
MARAAALMPHLAPAVGERRPPPWLGPCYVVAYLLLDWVSFIDPIGRFGITPWNPPPGLSLALLLAFGLRQGVWLFVAALLAEFVVRGGPAPVPILIAVSLVLALGYTALAAVLRRLGVNVELVTLRDAGLFLVASAVATGLIALTFVGILVASGSLPAGQLVSSVRQFWLGDLIGIVVTTPFVLVLMNPDHRSSLAPDIVTIVQGLAIVAALWVVFGAGLHDPHEFFYVLFLPLIWIAMRHGMAGTAIATLVIQLLLIGTLGIVAVRTAALIDYQFLMLTLAGTGLILGAAVSERRLIARQLRDKQFELDRSLRLASASELASAMAHELQQPLTALGNYVRASAVMAERADVPASELVATMQKALAEADRAGQVVRRLRDFFRAGTVRAESIDAGALVAAAAETLRERARRHAVDITVTVEPGVPMIHVDRLQIEGVLQNLLSNAIDALKAVPSPRRLGVDLRAGASEEVIVTIEDNGSGVAPDIADDLFRHFATSKPHGMGLGLAIARSVIEAHGGRIWHEPRSPGSAFRFTLPTTPRHA